ncbi:MAG: LLM class flavin-dependent oxidoreductase [Bradyrhizobium sp.]
MTNSPHISIRLHGAITARRCVELARLADAAGFTSVWFAENAFARGILPAAAACAAATERLQIGAGVFNPFSRHPTMMAMEIGALDELSNGRATLGIGSGIGSAVEKIGFSADKPLLALRDTLAIVRGLLRGEEVDYAGKAFSAKKVKLGYRSRADIPIFLAGRGDLTLKFCGEAADGLIISNMCSVEFAGRAAAIVQSSRRAAGRTGTARVVHYMPCAVRKDGNEAMIAAKRAIGEMLPGFWSLGQRIAPAKEGLLAGTHITEEEFAAAANRLRAGEDAAQVLDERFVESFSLSGTPDECLARTRIFAASGITELALTFDGPTACEDIMLLGEALGRRSRA